jgi:hypothetical protein
MAGNKAVAYMGPGKVEVLDTDYPTLELRDGPGVNPANVGRTGRSSSARQPTSAAPISTWCAGAPPPRRG